ncbi:MAG TPA: type II toxin-antitoxin system VapC family toxin [Mycobacteriales bacterium]|nr:type II toxin-antitoxin system VapC family toxin [Mycobacteriales bacterium]
MTVIDASAVLALIYGEPGVDVVAAALATSSLSAVNLAEVVGKLIDRGADVHSLMYMLESTGVEVRPLTADGALLAGALRSIEGGTKLSLADRCCLALALSSGEPVLTADRAWTKLDLAVDVQLIR